jgi:hypothetical protein
MNSPTENIMKSAAGIGCAGAVLIHPVLLLLGFAKGALFGHPQPQVMSPTSAHGSVESGFAGGVNAVEDILVHYVMTLGIALVIVSLAGTGLALFLMRILSIWRSPHL